MSLIPLFPLGQVLFPGAELPIRVFEPRYRALVRHCVLHQEPFGVVGIRRGSELDPAPLSFRVGTLARIGEVSRLPGGESEVLARGETRFRLVAVAAGAAYPQAEVEPLPDLPSTWYADTAAEQLRPAYEAYRRGLVAMGLDLPAFHELPKDPTDLSWAVAQNLVVELEARQLILEERRPLERLRREISLLRREATFVERGLANRLVRPPSYTLN